MNQISLNLSQGAFRGESAERKKPRRIIQRGHLPKTRHITPDDPGQVRGQRFRFRVQEASLAISQIPVKPMKKAAQGGYQFVGVNKMVYGCSRNWFRHLWHPLLQERASGLEFA